MKRFVLGVLMLSGLAACRDRPPADCRPHGGRSTGVLAAPTCDPRVEPCPANSPEVNSFAINGLLAGGHRCNREGVRPLPKSLEASCGKNLDLDIKVVNGRAALIGRAENGDECSGHRLEGATLRFQSWIGLQETVTISAVKTIPSPREGDGEYEGYVFTHGEDTHPLCYRKWSNELRRRLWLSQVPDPEGDDGAVATVLDGAFREFAIVVPGTVYDSDNDPVPAGSPKERWFNLACFDDAIAKMAIYKLDNAQDPHRNRAVLDALTARYCPRRPYTKRGILINVDPNPATPSEFREADWGKENATCLARPRLMERYEPKDLESALQPPSCKHKQCTKDEWIAGVRAECGKPLGDCSQPPSLTPVVRTNLVVPVPGSGGASAVSTK